MMIRKNFIAVLVALGMSIYATTSLAVTKYNFSQSGFDDGAILTGMFEAEDLDGDGVLTELDGIITVFSVEFSGNSLVPAFILDSTDDFSKFDVVYDLDDESLDGATSDESLFAFGSDFSVFVGSDPLGECENGFCGVVNTTFGEPVTVSLEPVIVSAVPLPQGSWLFVSGLLGLIGKRLKKAS
jgi:hypothetical protein